MLAKVAVVLLSVLASMSMAAGSSAGSGEPRSEFCRPDRSLQSFGGRLGRRVTGFGAHLVAAPETVAAGHTPAIRLLNVGTDELSYGPRQTQRWTDRSWKAIPQGYQQAPLDYLHPGSVSRCIGPVTGRRWPAGKYRWVVEAQSFTKGGVATSHRLRTVFHVRAYG